MDIHRCRFFPYQPSSINALAFSHTSNLKLTTPTDLRLALGRENGDVEIWNPSRGHWTQERIFRGAVKRTIEQLLWTQPIAVEENEGSDGKFRKGILRLYSSGGSPSVTEWDIEKGVAKRHADGNKGDVWCMAAQPQWTSVQQNQHQEEVKRNPAQLIAAGCFDGSIVLFSTADGDLQYDRILVQPLRRKSKVVSITWKDRDTIIAGYEESVIRVIDVPSRRVLRNITLGKSTDGDPPIVWTVKCLPNGSILSGDSTGELKIWDSQNYSLIQRLKTHNADVLDIATNTAGTLILTCGVDRRTVAYALRSETAGSRAQRWHETRHRRFHQHDVKAITAFESKELSLAVSGGVDTVPAVLPLQNWDVEYHRSLPYLPQDPQMSVSPVNRLILSWWGRDLFIWNLPMKRPDSAEADPISEAHLNHKLLGRLQLKGEEFITSAEISASGDLVIAATNAGVKLFQIRKTISVKGDVEVRFRPLDLPHTIAGQGVGKVGFSPDSKWLYAVRLNNIITMARIVAAASTKERPTIVDQLVKLDRKRRNPTLTTESMPRQYVKHIKTVAFSSDSRILAVGDLSGSIDTWILTGSESMSAHSKSDKAEAEDFESESDSDSDDETESKDVLGQKWIRTPGGQQLPQLDSAILVLTFKPISFTVNARKVLAIHQDGPLRDASRLIAITSSHEMIEFDILNSQISEWSRRNPSSLLPASFRLIKDRVMGAWWHCTENHERLWMYGEGFVYMVDTAQDMDPASDDRRHKKRRRIGVLGNHIIEAPEGHVLHSAVRGPKIEHDESIKKKRKTGGAGGEMRQGQQYAVKFRKLEHNPNNPSLLSPPESTADHPDTDEDLDMPALENSVHAEPNELVLSRRKERQSLEDVTGQESHSAARHEEEESEESETNGAGGENKVRGGTLKPTSWHTFQYRGIFGACVVQHAPLDEKTDESEFAGTGPEVVIVERPMYDVEMMPRFTNGQEW